MSKIYLKSALTVVLAAFVYSGASAQDDDQKGRLSVGFESNSVVYARDNVLDLDPPRDHFGSNDYLKLDYVKGRFSAGVQFETYLPVLQGYPTGLKGADIIGRYVSWTDKNFSITAGGFYEQFGSGLVLRSWEDRQLGFNNMLEGARLTYTWNNIINLKGIWARPRMYMEYVNNQVRGLDANVVVSEIFGWNPVLILEGSVVNRYSQADEYEFVKPNTNAYSGRVLFEAGGFSLSGEYVHRSSDVHLNTKLERIKKSGNAILAEAGYNGNGLGVLATFRMMEYMAAKILRDQQYIDGNMLNYIPALTQQYTYSLTNLNPFSGSPNSEIGGQFDIFYNFKRGTALGGARGTKIHLNFATFYTLDKEDVLNPNLAQGQRLFTGIGFDIEKWWNRNLKTTVLYNYQDYNDTKGEIHGDGIQEYLKSHIIVGDVTYKFTPTFSLRGEVQYLVSNDGEKDWIAGQLELNFAPKWSVYGGDMYNLGNDNKDDRVHYYNVGFSFTHSRTRLALQWGRNRAGYLCSGGVCRIMPAYTGLNATLSMSF